MEPLIVNPTEDTPKIVFDPGSNFFEISGRSLPENVLDFYKPVLNWIDELTYQSPPAIQLDVKLEYFNTASSKILLDLLVKLENLKANAGSDITIRWHYQDGEEDMKDAGEEYAELVSLNFNFIAS